MSASSPLRRSACARVTATDGCRDRASRHRGARAADEVVLPWSGCRERRPAPLQPSVGPAPAATRTKTRRRGRRGDAPADAT
jgi:hypothetical protein